MKTRPDTPDSFAVGSIGDFTGRQVLRAFNAYKDGMKQRRQEKKEKKEAAKHGHEVHDEL